MRRFLWFPVLAAALLAGCITIYKTDTQQGNVVTQEMLDNLKSGMTRAQVRFVLGTPLVSDEFHPDRWDYYYYFRKGGDKAVQTRTITVIFDKDSLKQIEGDTVARSANATSTQDATPPAAPAASAENPPADARQPRAL